jgi:2-oxoglutarate dehydrogenase E2 component (dihydrolipoamide succinyltransferase)
MASTELRLPPFPLGSQQATIARWLRQPGEPVATGDPLLVVVNDRVELALPATGPGILGEILAAEGVAAAVGALLATITERAADEPQPPRTKPEQENAPVRDPQTSAGLRRLSPVARRVAELTGIDITGLNGSGIGGRILKADVLAALAIQERAAPYQLQDVPDDTAAGWFGRTQPFQAIETYALTAIDVDLEHVSGVIAHQRDSFARRGLDLTYLTCIALAAIEALAHHPLLNSAWDGEQILARRRVQLAIVPTEPQPVAIICDAQDLNLRGLARASAPLQAARSTKIEDNTFTIADLGDRVWGDPSEFAQRQSAALGVGAIRRRPWVIADSGVDRIVVRPVALLTLAYDTRILDQRQADAFLHDIKQRLERFNP